MRLPPLEAVRSGARPPRRAGQVDFDLHGLAGVRLLGAGEADVAAVARQLGPLQAELEREPEIVVRFVDRLPASGPLRYLGVGDAAFTNDAFVLLRSRHKARARVSLPLDRAGGNVEIVCERGLPAVPLLIPVLNLTVLARGALPLHASAFLHDGVGVVCTGWSKGGKTEALLAFAAHGAGYVADEWVYVASEGDRVFGIPEPVRLWDWHLRQLPTVRAGLERRERMRLTALRLAESVARRVSDGGAAAAAGRRAAHLVGTQLHVDVPPERLFRGTLGDLSAPFDRLFFIASHEASEIVVEPVDPLEVARRMVFSLLYERLDLARAYLEFRFAFPERSNPLIERAEELQREALARVFAGKRAYAVRHPYPVSLEMLYEAMEPYCR